RQIYTLSLHDALPISNRVRHPARFEHQSDHLSRFANRHAHSTLAKPPDLGDVGLHDIRFAELEVRHPFVRRPSELDLDPVEIRRSEEHTSELQSPCNL